METKTCPQCKVDKPLTPEFYYKNNTLNGYQSWCKECVKQAAKERHAENMQSPEYRKKRDKQRKKGYAKKNKTRNEKYANDPNYRKRKLKKNEDYRKQKKDTEQFIAYRRAKDHRRRARKRKAIGTITGELIQEIYELQGGLCLYCEQEVGQDYHIDHIIPLAKGGDSTFINLAVTCPKCNRSKNASLLTEWLNCPFEV